jgi:hypothetical protein
VCKQKVPISNGLFRLAIIGSRAGDGRGDRAVRISPVIVVPRVAVLTTDIVNALPIATALAGKESNFFSCSTELMQACENRC